MIDNNPGSFFVGMLCGILMMALAIYFTTAREFNSKRTECELKIPRNQSCVMQFVPEKK